MPIKQNNKLDIAFPATKNNGVIKQAGLFTVDDKGVVNTNSVYGLFLLNPSSFDDSKSSNWVQQAVPGQSDPVLQWVSSGARTLTFDAFITKDTSILVGESQKKNYEESYQNSVKELFAGLAGSFAKVQEAQFKVASVPIQGDLSITRNLDYYRSLLYPLYEKDGDRRKLKSSPPRLVLLVGDTLYNTIKGPGAVTSKDVTWVLTELKVKVTKMLPNLTPMEAIVSFTLVAYNQESFSSDDIF